MDDREALTHLRSLVYQGDRPGLVRLLSEQSWPADSLQLIGDGLLNAVRGGVDGASELARTCVEALAERDPLRGGGRIDLRTGEVWPQAAIEYAEEVGEIEEDDDDPDRWLWVHCEASQDGYRDMEWFIEDLDDAAFAARLARAITGPAPSGGSRTGCPNGPS